MRVFDFRETDPDQVCEREAKRTTLLDILEFLSQNKQEFAHDLAITAFECFQANLFRDVSKRASKSR